MQRRHTAEDERELQVFFDFVTGVAKRLGIVVDQAFFRNCREIGPQRLRRVADNSKYPDLKSLANALCLKLSTGREGSRLYLALRITDYFCRSDTWHAYYTHPKSE